MPLTLGAWRCSAIVFPLISGDDADIDSAANAMSYAALALGLNIVVGMAGLLDLGYAAFFAIGAYFYGILSSLPVAAGMVLVLGAVLPTSAWSRACQGRGRWTWCTPRCRSGWPSRFRRRRWRRGCGIVFGAPTLRLRGDYLAIVTLGFGEIVPIIARNWTASPTAPPG